MAVVPRQERLFLDMSQSKVLLTKLNCKPSPRKSNSYESYYLRLTNFVVIIAIISELIQGLP
ncbi:hypothetical protein SAMN04487993_10802 [Salipiger marinus]|uniref:Uncharacterized protein n=1 Tax=Salipiger marinus TaxID=555512 RepID=A0A1G8VA83_9RHOB|nr:hypothetical protein SAMN04487993_10802 [Salipiger marinus]